MSKYECFSTLLFESFSRRWAEIDWRALINLVDELALRTYTELSTSPCVGNLPRMADDMRTAINLSHACVFTCMRMCEVRSERAVRRKCACNK